ncbi:MAG: hypothetical protein KGJ59_13355 [Bacteroidota bacterium]|nr:hypothetical protein [Bacteroidota bacterium]
MKRLLLLFVLPLMTTAVLAQSSSNNSSSGFDGTVSKLAGDAAKGFVQPVVTGFGADLNGGWFHKAPTAEMYGFDFEFGVVAMGSFISDNDRTFSASSAFQFSGGYYSGDALDNPSGEKSQAELIAENIPNWYNPLTPHQQIIDKIAATQFQVGISGPTIVGSKSDTMKVTIPGQDINLGNNQTYHINDNTQTLDGVTGVLDGASTVPLAAPQLSIGTLVGTQLTFRWLPQIDAGSDIGKIKYFGFGIQHNPGLWFANPLPVDVAVSFFTQDLKIGSIFETKTTAFGINASKRFGPGAINITPYAGFMIESSKMTVTYAYTYTVNPNLPPVSDQISFELEGANKTRLTLGVSIKLLFLNINADYNLGSQNSATAGLMFII